MIPLEYPAVLGSPVGGVVQALGEGVNKVAVGDRIVCGTKIFTQKEAKYGGTQRYTLVDESEVIEVSAQEALFANIFNLRENTTLIGRHC